VGLSEKRRSLYEKGEDMSRLAKRLHAMCMSDQTLRRKDPRTKAIEELFMAAWDWDNLRADVWKQEHLREKDQ